MKFCWDSSQSCSVKKILEDAMKSKISRVVFFLVLVISINLVAVPETINFQGALKDANGVPVNDTQFMEFRIYDLNNLLWSEQHLTVEIVDGIFSEELGLFSQFPPGMFDYPELYITFFYGGEEMTPRQKLHSVPYALQAEDANHIGDVALSGLVQQDLSGNATITGTMTAGTFVGDGSGITNIGSFDDLYVHTTGPDTIYANSGEAALSLDNYGSGNGIQIDYTGNNGISVNYTGNHGIYVSSPGDDGVYISNAGDDGIHVYNAGFPSSQILGWSNNGIEIEGAEGYGLFVGRADESGVYIQEAGGDGLFMDSVDDYGVFIHSTGNDGVYVNQAGDWGVYANTEQVSHEWGMYTNDKIYGSNITTRSMSTHVRYIGDEILDAGDLVCIAGGYEENVLGEDHDLPVVNVTKANSSNSEAVLGVVEYKVDIRVKPEEPDDRKTEVQKSFRYSEGSVSSGDYLSVIVFGPMDVNLDSKSNIKTGEKLTVADNGYTRSITDDDNWRIGILGKALEDSNGSGKIKVFVNCK